MFYFLQKDYKRDLETEIKGRGMQVSADTLDIQRAMKASEMASQVRNKWDSKFKTSTLNCVQTVHMSFHLCGLEIQMHGYLLQEVKQSSEDYCPFFFQKEYKKDLENEIKGKGMQVSMDIPDMLRAKRASEIYSEVGRE